MAKQHQMTATEIAALKLVTREARNHAKYGLQGFTERDNEGDMIDGTRLTRIAPVRALESLLKPNSRRSAPFLELIHLKAANAFHADIEQSAYSQSHELKEFVNSPMATDCYSAKRVTAITRVEGIARRMSPNMWAYARTIFIYDADKPMSKIFPNVHKRRLARDKIKDMLEWLATEYGLQKRN